MKFFGMKHLFPCISAVILLAAALPAAASAQTPEKPLTVEERAAKEADRLQMLLDLDLSQVFLVDSTLQHDLGALDVEIKDLQRTQVYNSDLYQIISDKWAERIDRSYERIFHPAQWARYLKTGGARAQKARDKRRARYEGLRKN